MPYKDKQKASEASAERMRRYRANKAVTPVTPSVTPESYTPQSTRKPLSEVSQGLHPTPLVSSGLSGLAGVKALSVIRKLPVYNPNQTGFHPAPKVK